MAPALIPCEKLHHSVVIGAGDQTFGRIQAEPLFNDRQPLSAVLKKRLPETVYLDRVSSDVCAYPVIAHRANDNLGRSIFSEEDRRRPAFFGTPSSMRIGESSESYSGAIYDRNWGLFMVRNLHGAKWFLVGDNINYQAFVSGIEQFAGTLFESFAKQTELRTPAQDFDQPRDVKPNVPTPWLEATDQLIGFHRWLDANDPVLAAELGNAFDYVEDIGSHVGETCGNKTIDFGSFAFYDAHRDFIYFMPAAIELLKRGEYQAVAQITAHELAHRNSHQRELTAPSEQLLGRSVNLFLNYLIQTGSMSLQQVEKMGPLFNQTAYCQFLPLGPEEEQQAFLKEIDYASRHPSTPASVEMSMSAHLIANQLGESMLMYFPEEWAMLAVQYVYNSLEE